MIEKIKRPTGYKSAPRRLNEISSSQIYSSYITWLTKETRKLNKLTSLLSQWIDVPLREHVRIGRIEGDHLVLFCDQPEWAFRTKYLCPTILEKAKTLKGCEHINSIEARTIPNMPSTAQFDKNREFKSNTQLSISDQSATSLRNLAHTIDHERLKNALYRVSSRKLTK